jgi:hypothetical protein
MMNNLIPFERKISLENQYTPMLNIIDRGFPEIQRATQLFQKTQSQFMDNMLTVSHITPIRNLRQILAEMKNTRLALGEAYYSIEKKKIDVEEKRIKLIKSVDSIEKQRTNLEIEELEWQISCIMENVGGAIRKLTNYSLQYESVMKENNLQDFDELDFEAEEEAYHITKAFEQGLNAARAHSGFIDEGNQIYFSQIGINGTVAQVEVTNYLNLESEMLSLDQEPTHVRQIDFLISMAEKFRGCSKKFAQWKGMPDTKQVDALIKHS